MEDFKSAEANLGIGRFYLVAFLCHQAVEKALKALYIEEKKESPGTAHFLVYLGQSLGAPEEILQHLRRMSPDYVVARYPNAAHGIRALRPRDC